MRVMIVDDYPGTVQAAGRLLTGLGHECGTATCGAEALTMAKAFRPDLVIVDIGLPDIDGYALLRALRSQVANHPPCIVAMSGWACARIAALEEGFDDCLLKPVGREAFVRVIELTQRRQPSGGDVEHAHGVRR